MAKASKKTNMKDELRNCIGELADLAYEAADIHSRNKATTLLRVTVEYQTADGRTHTLVCAPPDGPNVIRWR